MKKIFSIAAIAAATILALSCAKEEEGGLQKKGIQNFWLDCFLTTYALSFHIHVCFPDVNNFSQYVRNAAEIAVNLCDSLNIPNMTLQYTSPQVKVIEIATRDHILSGSLGGTPSNTDWTPGSDSTTGFGGDE